MSRRRSTGPQRSKFRALLGDRGRYRLVDLGLWHSLKGLDSDAIALLMYLWSGPHSTPHGILHLPDVYLLHDLGWEDRRLKLAWAALDRAELVWRDGDLCVIVPFTRVNSPDNPKMIVAWRRALATLPASPLYGRLYQYASAWLSQDGLSWLKEKTYPASRLDTLPDTVSDTVSGGYPSGLRTQDSVPVTAFSAGAVIPPPSALAAPSAAAPGGGNGTEPELSPEERAEACAHAIGLGQDKSLHLVFSPEEIAAGRKLVAARKAAELPWS